MYGRIMDTTQTELNPESITEAVIPADSVTTESVMEDPRRQDEEKRAEFAKALTDIAQAIIENPTLPIPGAAVHFYVWPGEGHDPRAVIRTFIRAFPGPKVKNFDSAMAEVSASVGPVSVNLSTIRDSVCERVVVGTKDETREVPDPEALANIPCTEVTVTEDIIEWRCEPLLAE